MTENIDNESLVKSKAVVEVIAIAAEYCLFVENLSQYEKEERIPFLQKLLTALYLKGLFLPTINIEDETYTERFVTEEEYELVRVKLANAFADIDYFSAVDLMEKETDAAVVSLAELLSDVYLDLKDFLLLYQKNTLQYRENAVALCKACFQSNWGYKITLILYYLHTL